MGRTGLIFVAGLLGACSDQSLKTFNAEPKAEIVSHSDGAEVQEEISTMFWGKVSDSDDDIDELEVTWFVDEDELCAAAAPDEGGESFCAAELGADATKVVLQVTDPGSATGSDQVQITVVPTQAPTAQITAPDRTTVYYSDQKLTFEGQLSDAEDALNTLTAIWSSDLDLSLIHI